MTLAPHSSVGPYEILGPLGSGGMGEVYRARDGRLGRDVALKVLHAGFARDPERLRRFEQEARAVALLSHPHVLQIFDMGRHEGAPYLVMELLEGDTLRARLDGGPLPLRKALDLAQQVARGLAAAHEKGIIHRDLKPENIFIGPEDRVKILDFGLAKLQQPDGDDPERTQDRILGDVAETRLGTVMGTVGYMSPEQVGGKAAGIPSDIFSLGIILWEMITGRRPFAGASAVETLHAILKEDPPEHLADLRLPVALERTLRRCLEKEPSARFQSARDLAFNLENATLGTSTLASHPSLRLPRFPWRRIRIPLLILAGAVLGLLGFTLGRTRSDTFSFHRLTYQTGIVKSARFAKDGTTIVYSIHRTGLPDVLLEGRTDGLGSRALDLPPEAQIQSISSTGEMALLLVKGTTDQGTLQVGTLAQAPLSGGAPREILENVLGADWGPDGQELAVVRIGENGRHRLEFPLGHLLLEAPDASLMERPRVSPKGDRVAVQVSHGAGLGQLLAVDRKGRSRVLARGTFGTHQWSADGSEVLFTVRPQEDRQELHGVTLSGRDRLVYPVLGRMRLHDVSRTGRLLVEHTQTAFTLLAHGPQGVRDLTWLQSSMVADVSADGKTLLFGELREGLGPGGAYLRGTDGSQALRLGDGDPLVLSPDGKWALVRSLDGAAQLVLLPTGPGQPRRLPAHGVKAEWATFLRDGRQLLLGGVDASGSFRAYRQDLQTGDLTPWREVPRQAYCLVSPDGRTAALGPIGGTLHLAPLDGGPDRVLPGLGDDEWILQWSLDGGSLYVARMNHLPVRVFRLDLATGRRTLWKEIAPADPSGVSSLHSLVISPDGLSWAYSFNRTLFSELYLMDRRGPGAPATPRR